MSGDWQPPVEWQRITTIEAHTAGEPLRVLTGGFPQLPGDTILAKRRYARESYDHLRTALMWEPRGHADMYGCILTESVTADGEHETEQRHAAGEPGAANRCARGRPYILPVLRR